MQKSTQINQAASKPINVVMVDSSYSACRNIEQLLTNEKNIVFSSFTDPEKALAELEKLSPTTIFKDIDFPDPEKALLELEKLSPTVIIQDIEFSDFDGYELLRKFRKNESTQHVPVLVLSLTNDTAIKNKAFSLGANDFFSKKGDKAEFVARVLYHAKRYNELKQFNIQNDSFHIPTKHIIKALMIDHSKAACLLVKKALNERGPVEFDYCTDSSDVLQKVDQLMPTVIIQSLSVSEFEGFSLLEELRKNESSKDIPVIVLSGIEDPLQKVKALQLGANDYVVKSPELTELVSRIVSNSSEYFNLLKSRFSSESKSKTENYAVKVLMVDDSKSICFAIGHMLKSEINIQFEYCMDGKEAVEKARHFSPTVILQDLEMPDINGLQLLENYREDPLLSDVPVIVISGTSDSTVKAKAFATGANDYVQKNMDKIELISRIQYHTKGYMNSLRLNDSIQDLLETQKRVELHGSFIKKTFGRYLSDDIVQSILDTPEGMKLGGESREISILMADLRGFTSLSENLPPKSVLSIINIFLSVMTEIIMKQGGTIDEFIGDAILAMFGAPNKSDDDAIHAVASAIAMQLAMHSVNQTNVQEGYPEVSMGIGINTGDVVVGNIGSEKRAKYGIVGRNVNLTSRIESYTVGGQILVSESTVKSCGDILRIDDQLTVMPKGVKEPITIYEIGGIGGEYNLYLPEKKEVVLADLAEKYIIKFSILEGKHAGTSVYKGTIEKSAKDIIEVSCYLEVDKLVNIKFSIYDHENKLLADDLYGKIVDSMKYKFKVHFTSAPAEIKELFA